MWQRIFLISSSLWFLGCDGINDGWATEGGGYMKYKINSEDPSYELEIEPDGVTLPGAICYSDYSECNHWASFDGSNSNSGDYLKFTVNHATSGRFTPQANTELTYFILANGLKAAVFSGSSEVHIKQADSSIWSGDFNLLFQSCGLETCSNDTTEGIRVVGTFQYWVEPD